MANPEDLIEQTIKDLREAREEITPTSSPASNASSATQVTAAVSEFQITFPGMHRIRITNV